MKRLMTIGAMVALGAWTAVAAPNFPLGTHLVKGSVRGYDEDGRNIILSSARGVTIRAVNTNGQIIAESKVKDATAEGINFGLQIPLSTTATDSTCAVGDKLNCVMVEASGIRIGTEPIIVGGARETQTLTLRLVDVKRYVSADGGRTNEVAQAYVDAIQAWMSDEAEFKGQAYDPFADYDKDLCSNYAEYLAGTNPFDPSDKLSITAFAMADGVAAISFEYVGGHVYGASYTSNLLDPEWLKQKIRETQDGEELSQVVPSADPADVGGVTIYMTPAAKEAQGYFRLEAK